MCVYNKHPHSYPHPDPHPRPSCVLGCNKLGISATRIAQAAEVRIRVRAKSNSTAMQIDGEPWLQPNATVSVTLTYCSHSHKYIKKYILSGPGFLTTHMPCRL